MNGEIRMDELTEITNRKSQLELQKGSIEREVKALTAKQQHLLVKKTTETLLNEQQEKGSLDRLTLEVFLQELATATRNLYDK